MSAQQGAVEILLAEDNAADAELTLRALKKHHLSNRVHWVRDGAEALDYLFQAGAYAGREPGLPKLLLLDINMPKVDGLDVLRQLREHARMRDLAVIVMTSSRHDFDILESARLGVVRYIVKPVQFGAFAETVAQLGFYWAFTAPAADPAEHV